MKNEIIKTQGMEFQSNDILAMAQDGLYIVQYKTIYNPVYSKSAGARLEKVYRSRDDLPLTKRGQFHVMGFRQVNDLLGFELLIG